MTKYIVSVTVGPEDRWQAMLWGLTLVKDGLDAPAVNTDNHSDNDAYKYVIKQLL